MKHIAPLSLLFLLLFFNLNCLQPTEMESSTDTLYVFTFDTLVRKDTVHYYDTMFYVGDTVYNYDSLFSYDTVYSYDTMVSKDTVVRIDTVRNIDTLVFKDTLVSKDTVISKDTLFSVSVDTVYVSGSSRYHVFFGAFSTTLDSVERDGNSWLVQLPISIGKDWVGLVYVNEYSSWEASALVQDYFSITTGSGFAIYRVEGMVIIADPGLELQDMYWKIVLIEPL